MGIPFFCDMAMASLTIASFIASSLSHLQLHKHWLSSIIPTMAETNLIFIVNIKRISWLNGHNTWAIHYGDFSHMFK